MTTTATALTNTAWVDLGPTPMVVYSVSDRDSARLVVADAAPAALDTGGLTLSTRNVDGIQIYGTGQHVYARATNHATTVVVLPFPAGGSGGGAANPYPGSDYANTAKQDTGNTTLASLLASIGATSDAATVSGAASSAIGALRAIRDRLLGTLSTALVAGSAIVGRFGIDQTTPGTTNGVVVNSSALPAGAATAANQTTELASLATIQQRAITFADQAGASVAASTNLTGASRDAGANPPYAKFNVVAASTQSGTLFIQGSNDNFTTLVAVGSVTVAANVPSYLTVPVMFRYYRYVFGNGATAATVSINSSYTAA